MSTVRPPPSGSVPTLTEVVEWPQGPGDGEPVAEGDAGAVDPPTYSAAPMAVTPPTSAAPAIPAAPNVAAAPASLPIPAPDALTRGVLTDIERQVELLLEVRLREALAPVLARAADAMIRDARKELTAVLHDVVRRSVAQELARRNDR